MGQDVECIMTREFLAPAPNLSAASSIAYVDQQGVSIRDMPDLLARAEAAFARAQGFTLYTLNLDHLVKRRQNAAFRALYARATFVTADGWPVVSLARRAAPTIARTAGSDCVVPLCQLAARCGVSVALFGSTAAILDAAASRLRGLCPGLEIALCEAPPFGFDPLGATGLAAMTRIAASGARLCFVALGAPKQEIFADRAFLDCPDVGFACIGASLDFIAGIQRRAPLVVQRLRLEWAWRLAAQPRRLGRRYLDCAILFARLAVQARRSQP